jgi:uncharacterized DUF497 family protein
MWNNMAPRREQEFIWDEQKALANERKHGIGFKLATKVFLDPLSQYIKSEGHEDREDRWAIVGTPGDAVLIVVIHTYPEGGSEERVRIISARKATFNERREFESGEYSIREPEMTDEYNEPYEKAEGEWDFDFSKAITGKHRNSRFQIFIDNEVLGYFHIQEQRTGLDLTEAINEVLRRHVGLPVDSRGPAAERR